MFAQCDVEPPPKTRDSRECRRERRGTVCHAKTVVGGGGVNFAQSKIVVAFISVYTFVPFFPASLIVSSNPSLFNDYLRI